MEKWVFPRLRDLMVNWRYTDCTFVIEDEFGTKHFYGHRLLFSLASEVFGKMLYRNGWEKGVSEKFFLDDMDGSTFLKLRTYIYGYEKNRLKAYHTEDLKKLLRVGHKYLMQPLSKDCAQILGTRAERMEASSLMEICQSNDFQRYPSLIVIASNVIKNRTIVYASVNNGIYDLTPKRFYLYLMSNKDSMPEPIRFNYIELYLKRFCPSGVRIYNTKTLCPMHYKHEMLTVYRALVRTKRAPSDKFWHCFGLHICNLIDFYKLTPVEFSEGPGKSDFLTPRLKYVLLYYIAKNFGIISGEEMSAGSICQSSD